MVSAAAAQDVPGGSPNVLPLVGDNYATPDVVESAVGDLSISMDACTPGPGLSLRRVVRVQLSKPDFETDGVINSVLLRGAQYAWTACPHPATWITNGQPTGKYLYNIDEVDLYLPDGSMAYHAALGDFGLKGDWPLWPGTEYQWGRAENVVATRRAQQQAADAEAARQAAIAAQQAAAAQAAAAAQEASRRAAATFWGWVRGLLFLAFLAWLWSQRDKILRFFYGLTPHPAAAEIRDSLNSDRDHDPSRLAEMLAVTPESSVEREVRSRQARELMDEITSKTEQTRQELEEEMAFLNTQAGLAENMEVRARIKKRLDAILQMQGKM